MHRGRLGLADEDALEELGSFGDALACGHQAVFVFDGEDVVVAAEAQGGDEVAPERPLCLSHWTGVSSCR